MEYRIRMNKRVTTCVIAAFLLLTTVVPTSYAWAETQDTVGNQEVAASAITINKKAASIYYKHSTQLTAKVTPEEASGKTVTWTSSNKNIASVNSKGTVKGVNPGTAIITASADGVKAVCKVKVLLEKPVLTKISSVSYHEIKLSWKKVDGAAGYKIYRATSPKGHYKGLKKTKLTSKVVGKCTTGKKYYYKVRAYKNVGGSEVNGELSKSASMTSKPSKAAISSIAPGVHKATIKMKKVKGATGYAVYRATSLKGKYKRVRVTHSPKVTSYTNAGLTGGKSYYYKIRAYKKMGKKNIPGAFSTAKKVTPKKTNLKYNKAKNFYYKDKFTVKAYAYSGGGHTAMGTRARVGAIAVDPRVISLGTNVYVNGYGFARAEDTGGNIKGRTIDVYKNSSSACYKWGVRYKTIYVGVKRL